jgi:MoaA/NifB/PqqE/SkfB family radical SAM enzyme
MKQRIGYGVNWFLTRKCNLRCSYCAIVRPNDVYPDTPFKEDVDIEKAKLFISRLKKHNPDAFHMFLGGEPTVYPHLKELIEHCNKEGVLYTIITNMTDYSYKRINQLLDEVGYINGLSFTIDTVLWQEDFDKNDDRYKKSISAYEKFMSFRLDNRIREFVAIVGVDSNNINYLHEISKELSDKGVWIDLILIETKLNKYYDFPTDIDYDMLIYNTPENIKILEEVYKKAEDGEYYVLAHQMIKHLLISNLPQHYNCIIDKYFDTITIDSDSKFRLCLRIRGTKTPNIDITEILDDDGNLTNKYNELLEYLKLDKKDYCYGCMWTCPMFGELIGKGIIKPEDMNHDNIELEYKKEA